MEKKVSGVWIVIGVLFVGFLAVVLFPVFAQSKSAAKRTAYMEDAVSASPASAPMAEGQESTGYMRRSLDTTGGITLSSGVRAQMRLASNPTIPPVQRREVIRKADIDIRVENVEKAEKAVSAIVQSAGGYTESATSSDLASTRPVLKLALRVPVASFDSSISKFESLGVRLSKTIGSEDVTGQLIDLDARLKTLTAKEDVFREMLKNRSQLEDVFNIQNQLTEVRTEIESISGQRKSQAGLAALSTIGLTLEQDALPNVASTDPNWMAQTWAEASSGASVAFRIFVVALVWIIAFSPFWIPAAFILRKVVKNGTEARITG